jgi:hypothetical protein
MISVSKSRHPFLSVSFACSDLSSCDQARIQKVALKITCMNVLGLALLNTISFLFNHIAQHKAAAPSKIWLISFRGVPFSHDPSKSEKLEGG